MRHMILNLSGRNAKPRKLPAGLWATGCGVDFSARATNRALKLGMRHVCPYCAIQTDNISRDHIFSEFLGGTRTIPACAKCNNKDFGARFESTAARNLLSFQLMLSSLGISGIAIREGTKWINAHEHEGESYDLEYRDGGLIFVLSTPKITRDGRGRVISIEVRSMEEAKAHKRRLPKGSTIESKLVKRPVPFDKRDFKFSFGPDFG